MVPLEDEVFCSLRVWADFAVVTVSLSQSEPWWELNRTLPGSLFESLVEFLEQRSEKQGKCDPQELHISHAGPPLAASNLPKFLV